MRMKPRNYGTFNRIVARSVTHAINNYYRRKPKNYKSNNNKKELNSITISDIAIGVIVLVALLILFV